MSSNDGVKAKELAGGRFGSKTWILIMKLSGDQTKTGTTMMQMEDLSKENWRNAEWGGWLLSEKRCAECELKTSEHGAGNKDNWELLG